VCDGRAVQDFKIFLSAKNPRLSEKNAGLTHKSFLMGESARDTRGKDDAKIEKCEHWHHFCISSFRDTEVTQQKYIYAARLQYQKKTEQDSLIVSGVLL